MSERKTRPATSADLGWPACGCKDRAGCCPDPKDFQFWQDPPEREPKTEWDELRRRLGL